MRSMDEIVKAIKEPDADDIFGFKASVLVCFVPFDVAKTNDFSKDDVTEQQWNEAYVPLTKENVVREMASYMTFAWGKALDHRGLSAERSVQKMGAWLWLLEDEKLIENVSYPNYGAPILRTICQKYGMPIPEETAAHRMADGLPCSESCDEGCGR